MFSTVRGHVFEWTLLKDEESLHQELDPESILSFVQFEDSVYSTDPIIDLLEDRVLLYIATCTLYSYVSLSLPLPPRDYKVIRRTDLLHYKTALAGGGGGAVFIIIVANHRVSP